MADTTIKMTTETYNALRSLLQLGANVITPEVFDGVMTANENPTRAGSVSGMRLLHESLLYQLK